MPRRLFWRGEAVQESPVSKARRYYPMEIVKKDDALAFGYGDDSDDDSDDDDDSNDDDGDDFDDES